MKSFNVLLFEFQKEVPTTYDIMPYLISAYNETSKLERPKVSSFQDCKSFILRRLQYRFWSRCEYEFVMIHWPYKENNPLEKAYKIDVFEQCKINIDVITLIFISNLKDKYSK